MWLPKEIVTNVERVARVYYIDKSDSDLWNKNRKDGEVRIFCGWGWVGKDMRRQGFKSMSSCYRDAYYELVERSSAPSMAKGRLRLVGRRAA